MFYELISSELDRFVAKRERLVYIINEQRAYLQERADQGKASAAYVHRMNSMFRAVGEAITATDQLHEAIGFANDLLGDPQQKLDRLKIQNQQLAEENRKMRAWLQSMGKDLSLLHYVQESDLRYV
mgnify:CR=1 FL=1